MWQADTALKPDIIALVETHPDAAYHLMIEVLDELQRVGAPRISLRVLEPGRP